MMEEKKILNCLKKQGIAIIILLSLILIVLVVGVSKLYSNNENNTTNNTESEYNTEYDVSMFKEIKSSDLKKETKGKLKVVYIGRESCGWCAAFLPNLWKAQDDYGFETLYIDIAKIIDFNNGSIIDEDSYNILSKLTGDNFESYMEENFGATPMILIMKDNKIINAQTGYSEYENFETILNDSGIEKK